MMKFVILGLGFLGTVLFFLSLYSFMTTGKHFRNYALGFLASATAVFILVLIRTIKDQMDSGKNH